jgi:hypothetical protein
VAGTSSITNHPVSFPPKPSLTLLSSQPDPPPTYQPTIPHPPLHEPRLTDGLSPFPPPATHITHLPPAATHPRRQTPLLCHPETPPHNRNNRKAREAAIIITTIKIRSLPLADHPLPPQRLAARALPRTFPHGPAPEAVHHALLLVARRPDDVAISATPRRGGADFIHQQGYSGWW